VTHLRNGWDHACGAAYGGRRLPSLPCGGTATIHFWATHGFAAADIANAMGRYFCMRRALDIFSSPLFSAYRRGEQDGWRATRALAGGHRCDAALLYFLLRAIGYANMARARNGALRTDALLARGDLSCAEEERHPSARVVLLTEVSCTAAVCYHIRFCLFAGRMSGSGDTALLAAFCCSSLPSHYPVCCLASGWFAGC